MLAGGLTREESRDEFFLMACMDSRNAMVARGRPTLLCAVSASRGPDLSGPGAAGVTPRAAGETAGVCVPASGREATGLIGCEYAIDGMAMTILSLLKYTPI